MPCGSPDEGQAGEGGGVKFEHARRMLRIAEGNSVNAYRPVDTGLPRRFAVSAPMEP